jgi:hypothetical protein
VWIAHCIVHSTATREHPLLGQYSVALKWSDLHHLVFSEKAPTDAALAVAAYLKSYTNSGAVIFSLSDQRGTFEMAKEFSLNSSTILHVWDKELESAKKKRATNFDLVQRKQRSASLLRDEIAEHSERLVKLQREHADKLFCPSRQRILDKISIEKSVINRYNAELVTALKSPAMVLQALPTDQGAAMIMLFFCYMPEHLRTLARLTIMPKNIYRDGQNTFLLTTFYSIHRCRQALSSTTGGVHDCQTK